jgi:glutamine amidotransferase
MKRSNISVAIIDYGSGNLHSAQKAFEKAAASEGLTGEILVTSEPEDILAAERVVLPGVGAFGDCKDGLDATAGVLEALEEVVIRQARPFLGICVGMQLMAQRGLEHGNHAGLGWLSGTVTKIQPNDHELKIPHMGWNTLGIRRRHALLKNIPLGPDGLHAYFVHSYHFAADDAQDVIADVDYGGPITAMIGKDNIAGTQFHPEKSQTLGLALIANFLGWSP